MSISRAFTMRPQRRPSEQPPELPPLPPMYQQPARSVTMKGPGKVVDRRLISGPTFMHTTNTLALNAPDVAAVRALRKASSSVSSGSSRGSADDSDASSLGRRSRDTQLTDSSSVENSPSGSPNISNTDSYFHPKGRTSAPRTSFKSRSSYDLRTQSRISALSNQDLPEIPQRIPSHSKAAHESLARKRSLQQLSTQNNALPPPPPQPQQLTSLPSLSSQNILPPPPQAKQLVSLQQRTQGSFSMPLVAPAPAPAPAAPLAPVAAKAVVPSSGATNREQRVSIDMFSANVTDLTAHPFGKELEQLAAVASDYGNLDRDADISIMRDRRLARFCADDYILEIQPLFQRCFGPPMIQVDPVGGWI